MSNDTPNSTPSQHSLYPNTFQHPNLYIDRLAFFLTPQENTVLAKATREILGWQNNETHTKRISLSVFVEGKFKRGAAKTEENRLCYGCGLGREAVIKALDALDTFGILVKSGSPTNPKGEEYTLQFDAGKIDWEELERRKGKTKAKNVKRTRKARASLSDTTSTVKQTSTGLCDSTSNRSVAQTERNPEQKPKKETHHHHAAKPEKPEPGGQTKQHDDDGERSKNEKPVFSTLTKIGFDPPGQRALVDYRQSVGDPLLLEEITRARDWKGQPPGWFKRDRLSWVYYCLKNKLPLDGKEDDQRYKPRDLEGDKLAAYKTMQAEEPDPDEPYSEYWSMTPRQLNEALARINEKNGLGPPDGGQWFTDEEYHELVTGQPAKGNRGEVA